MAGITHKLVLSKPDTAPDDEVQPSDWNDTHVIPDSLINEFDEAPSAASNDILWLEDQSEDYKRSKITLLRLYDLFIPVGSVEIAIGSLTTVLSKKIGEWCLADGRALSRTTYAVLFGSIGTAYGPGDGSTTFNIPDLRDRFLVGANQEQGGTPKSLADGTLKNTGGNQYHTHANHPSMGHSGGSISSMSGATGGPSTTSTGAHKLTKDECALVEHDHDISHTHTYGRQSTLVDAASGTVRPRPSSLDSFTTQGASPSTSGKKKQDEAVLAHSHSLNDHTHGMSHGHNFTQPSSHPEMTHQSALSAPPWQAVYAIIRIA